MRDVGDYARHPINTIANKVHPLLGTMRDMLQNEDFFGHEIRNPDDPFVKQLAQEAQYIAGQFEPFGIRNARAQLDRGRKGCGAPKRGRNHPCCSRGNAHTRRPADVREAARASHGVLTPEEVQRQQARRNAIAAIRSQAPNAGQTVQQGIATGAIRPADIKPMLKQAAVPPDVDRFKQLPLAEAMHVYQLATPDEKKRFAPALINKMGQARSRGTLPRVLPPSLFQPQ